MITSISLGNIFTAGDKQVAGGGSTGLDTESIITGLTEAKRLPAVQLEEELELNAAKQAAFSELRDILVRYRSAADFLRNPPGVQNEADNIFQYRSATLTSNSSISAETYLTATAEPGASISTFDITVDVLATRNTKTTATFLATGLDAQAVGGGGPLNAGTLVLGPSSTAITLTTGDTFQDVINKVNAVKDTSGIELTVIKTAELGASDNYVMTFKAVETGTSQNYGDILVNNPGIFNVGFDIQDDAVDAKITVDGTTITRETNAIDDVIDGVTLNLNQVTPSGTVIEMEINADTETISNGIINFVDSYNELRLFASKQTLIGDDGLPDADAVLASNSTLRTVMNRIQSEMSAAVDGLLSTDPSRLADIGITFTDFPGDDETPFTRNVMVVDQSTLTAALEADPDEVRKIFEFDFTSDETQLQVYSRTNALDVNSFTLDINLTSGTFQATYDPGTGPVTINLDKTDITGGGILLKGQAGTVLEGLELIYTGTTDSLGINVTVTQGIGDRVYNTLDDMLAEDSGTIDVEIESINDRNDRIEQEIARIDELVERFRNSLLEKFAALEQAIASVNTILQSLDAQANAAAN